MNIGSIKQNDAGIFVGKIATLTIAMTIALREVQSSNPKAPKYEVLALSASRAWVRVGALFELFSNGTGESFLNGKIEDPSLAAPLYISAFRQEDGSFNLVWSRPTRRRDLAAEVAAKTDDALPPLPGDATEAPPVQEGLGESSAEHGFGGEQQEPGRRPEQDRGDDGDAGGEPGAVLSAPRPSGSGDPLPPRSCPNAPVEPPRRARRA